MTTFGIDLGTTYSCIAHIDADGRTVISKNADGDEVTPSAVFFESASNVIVGKQAKLVAKISPDQVVTLIKRSMGQPGVTLTFHGVAHTPESISALILKELVQAVEQTTDEKVTDVVITVPAYFGIREREATRNAGVIAGLNVLNLVPEPVAAALHYEALSAGQDQTILVYDLGGGTFDTTVIQMRGHDISVVCTEGDHELGGADWDERIAGWLLERFMADNPESGAQQSEEFLQQLANEAEDIKRSLSRMEAKGHSMSFDGGKARVELTRVELERMTADLLDRTFQMTQRTIDTARQKGVTTFDQVLLVGGSSRMPAVVAGLRERFGFEPRLTDPESAVAKGAARFALIESVKIALPDRDDRTDAEPAAVSVVAAQLGISTEQVETLAAKRVTSVVPRAFGVQVQNKRHPDADGDGNIVDHILRANDALPAKPPTRQYYTSSPDQTEIELPVYEQAGEVESARVDANRQIGTGLISGLPPLRQGSPIDVFVEMGETGALRVRAVELTTGREALVELQVDGLTQAEVAQARIAVAQYAVGN
ncbi:Hsp70 family protein [Dactylosporangium sp. NBC_01737]|uniref:Hsp70 family protein n=1 Tax=Dactylosporangium sp. NBC_01737 TaxID=2975959 RepID=UPI002E0E18AA|nr:Hsp70 family protein [Dactylosporangium sp. NBC_01737]